MQPALYRAAEWPRTRIKDTPNVEARVIVGISALLYLRVSTFVYGRTPADLDEATFVPVAAQLLGGSMP